MEDTAAHNFNLLTGLLNAKQSKPCEQKGIRSAQYKNCAAKCWVISIEFKGIVEVRAASRDFSEVYKKILGLEIYPPLKFRTSTGML